MIAVKLLFIILLSICFFKYFGKAIIVLITFLWKFLIALLIIAVIVYLIPDTKTKKYEFIEKTSLLA